MTSFPESELIAHAAALRSLARALVGAQNAEDLVQEVAVQALLSAPQASHGWFGWLQAILRNRARKLHRSEVRRRRREEHSAAATPCETPPRLAAHREMVAALGQALLAVAEPYQGTLLMRYFEDLTPTQIAARTGVPVATVKSRLQRGLGLLRERLVARVGSDWRMGLMFVWGIDRTTPVAAAMAAGVMLMGTTAKVLVGCVALGLATLAVLLSWSTLSSASLGAVAESPSPPAIAESGLLENKADRVAATGAGETARLPATSPEIGSYVLLRGRCVDETGIPLRGVSVHGSSQAARASDAQDAWDRATEADGTFTMQLPRQLEARIELQCSLDGRFTVRRGFDARQLKEPIELGDVVLPRAFVVRGRVVDTLGISQAGVEFGFHFESASQGREAVGLWKPNWTPSSKTVTTEADGSFSYPDELPAGHYWLQFESRRIQGSRDGCLNIKLGDGPREQGLEIVVEPAEVPVRGVVLQEDGAAVANASIRYGANDARSGADGSFEVTPNPNESPATRFISVAADGFEPFRSARGQAQMGQDLRIVLRREPTLVVRVTDARDGRPVTRFAASVLMQRNFGGSGKAVMGSHPLGVDRISAPAGSYFVHVRPEADGLSPSVLVPVEVVSGQHNEVAVALSPTQVRRLLLRDARGPVIGAEVELIDPASVDLQLNTEAFPVDQGKVGGAIQVQLLQVGQTDAAGALELRGPPAPLALRLRGGGLALQIVEPVRLDEPSELVVIAKRGAVLCGRLVPETVSRELFEWCNAERQNFGIELTGPDSLSMRRFLELPFPFAADGTFRIEGIPPGRWQVVVQARGRFKAAVFEAREGTESAQDLDVSAIAAAHITLRFMIDGVPASEATVSVDGWHATAMPGSGFGSSDFGRTDGEGRLSLESFAGDLVCGLRWQRTKDELVETQLRVTVPAAGKQEILVDARLGAFELGVLQPDGAAAGDVAFRLNDKHLPQGFATNSSGIATQSYVQAGTYALQVRPSSFRTEAGRNAYALANGWQAFNDAWLDVGTITVEAGKSKVQQVQLPAAWLR